MSGTLEHGPADIIGQLLVDLGVASDPTTDTSWPVSVSEDLATPDNAISVFDTQGVEQGSVHNDGEVQEQEGILIRIRARDYPTGFTKAHAIAIQLDQNVSYEPVLLGSKNYIVHSVNRTGGVIHVGKESPSSKRHLFTINAVVALTQTN